MCCGYANAQLTTLLNVTRNIAQPASVKGLRSHVRNQRNTTFLSQTRAVSRQRSPVADPRTLPSLSTASLERLVNSQTASSAHDAEQQHECTSFCVLGIDPDVNGAIALLRWHAPPDSTQSQLQLENATVALHDMPVISVTTGKKTRRQLDPLAIANLMGSLSISPGTEVRAVLEHPLPNALNGKWSWFSAGYNSGIWKGILMSHGIPFETVPARLWKADMELLKMGKEGSLDLAKELLPQTVSQLKRKKDHGRAEALLLAAWGVGVRRQSYDAAGNADAILRELDEAEILENELLQTTSAH